MISPKVFQTFGVMIDMSRNAVMSVPALKKYLMLLSKMGYNCVMLYTEDTYEVEGEPYFGYMRGRYSKAELKEIDAFASKLGMEIIPCIQTLAHLNALKRWGTVPFDCDDILMTDEERTYELIEHNRDWSAGKLAAPTVIDKIVLDYFVYGARARGGLIYGSTNGTDWEQIGQLPSTNAGHIFVTATVRSNKAYSYVKIEQADSLKEYDYSLGRINVFGYTETAERATAVNVPEMNVTADTSDPVIDLWSDTNTTARTGDDGDEIIESTVAKLAFPTKISSIYMVSGSKGGRNRGILYEGSMDGKTWETITSSGHQNDHVFSNGTKKVSVNGDKAYLYVRATNTLKNGDNKDWHWNVTNLAVYGEQIGASTYGTQVKVDTNTYAVRFIATLELLDYDKAGFEITATGTDITGEKNWDKEITTVYTSVKAGTDTYTAAQLGGEGAQYILAMTVSNISIASYGDITFTFTPYVEIDGERLYGQTGTVTYYKGCPIQSWSIAGTDLQQYRIVYSGAEMLPYAQTMRASIAAYTGHTLEIVQDTQATTSYEILMGDTNRAESDQVDTPTYLNYILKTVGSKLVVKAGGEHSLKNLFRDFAKLAVIDSQGRVSMGIDYQLTGNYYSDPYDTSVAKGSDLRVMSVNIMAEWESYGGGQSPVSTRKEIFFSALDY